MKVWRTILIFMMVLVLAWSLTACRQDDERNEQTPPEAETGEEIMLSDALVELSIWQQEDAAAEEIVTYEGAWPQRSVTFAVHDPEVAFKLRLQDEIDLGTAELEEAVAVTGAKVRISEGEDSQSFLVTLTEIQDRAEIKLGDLEPFRLRTRQDHLMFVLNQSELRVPYSLLIHGESDGRSHVFVSEIEDAIVLRFTEPMRPVEHPGTEWLSETQLKVDIAETAGTLPLDKFYSKMGILSQGSTIPWSFIRFLRDLGLMRLPGAVSAGAAGMPITMLYCSRRMAASTPGWYRSAKTRMEQADTMESSSNSGGNRPSCWIIRFIIG